MCPKAGGILFGVIAGTPKSFRPTEDRVMQGRNGGDNQCDREEQDTSSETEQLKEKDGGRPSACALLPCCCAVTSRRLRAEVYDVEVEWGDVAFDALEYEAQNRTFKGQSLKGL